MLKGEIQLRTGLAVLVAAMLGACADQGSDAPSSDASAAQAPAPAVEMAPGSTQALGATGAGAMPASSDAQPAVTAAAQAAAALDPVLADTGVEQAAEQVAAADVPGEQKAQTCLSCHSVENFEEFDAAALEAAMQSMRTGEMAHLPLPSTLTDQDLADIAAYLAEAARPAAES